MSRRKLILQLTLFSLGTAGLFLAIAAKWNDIAAGIAKISFSALILLSLLQIVSYLTRTQAWKMSLKRTDSDIPEHALQSSSGATFLLNCFVPMYLGQWLRMFLLKKFTSQPPKISQMATAEGANLFVEAIIILLILLATIPFLPFGLFPIIGISLVIIIVGLLIAFFIRRHPEHDWIQALHIFKDKKDLAVFSALLTVVIFIQPIRFYLVLAAIGNPESLITSALAFISTCISSILPFGPTASATGGVAAATGQSLALALTVGIVLAASAAVAALFYLIVAASGHWIIDRRKNRIEVQKVLVK